MNYYFFHNTRCLGDVNSFYAVFKCLQHPLKDTIEAAFIKHINDKTVVFDNQIMIGLLLLRTHGYNYCQTHGFTV